MKIKLFHILSVAFLSLIFCVNSAFAAIVSEYQIYEKQNKINMLASKNLSGMISKSELIGMQRSNFDIANSQYQNTLRSYAGKLSKIGSQVNIISSSSDLSRTEKEMQMQNLFQEADSILLDLNTKTIEYLSSASNLLPTLTYKRYVKKFLEIYNSYRFTNNKLVIE